MQIDLNLIKEIINNNKDLLLTLSTNSCIIENEDFAKMLMSILHLKEELATRYNVKMEDYELQHFKSDIETCYRLLTLEWVQYMKFLSNKYPFLFTKALINNPFDTRCKKEKDTVYLN